MVYASEPVGGEGPRAALRISKSIVSSALAHYMDRDRAVAMVRIGGQELMVVSQYCDINLRPVPPGLVTVVRFCQEKQIPLILGADTNAHSTNWGPDQNPRGDDFDDFIARNQLHILNDGLKPTYYHWVNNSRTKTYIDATFVNTFASNKGLGGEWTVTDDETFSDHKMITFTATATPLPPRLTRNLRKMDWQLFRTEIELSLIHI